MTPQRLDEFDALLVLSFGGPEGHADVRPFLENVTRGRGIPPERLDDVEEHYHHFGGFSPINKLNREIIANVDKELKARGKPLPIYFGNRNWKPFASEAAELMAADGVKNALVLATSAWGGYSGCKQYQEDIQAMIRHLESIGAEPITFTKIRQFYDHPRFVSAVADSIRGACAQLSEEQRTRARLVFTAHSIPVAADRPAHDGVEGGLYFRQVSEAVKLVADHVGISDYDLAWQSRSGAPHIPWYEPDIVDHAQLLHSQGFDTLIVCPIGFISDHMEVIWDLDSELMEEAQKWGMHIERARTIGPSAEFAAMIVDLIEELSLAAPIGKLGKLPTRGSSVNGAPCSLDCCATPRRGHKASISHEKAGSESVMTSQR